MTAIKSRFYFVLFELLGWSARMPEGFWEMARHVLTELPLELLLEGPALLAGDPVA